MTILIYRQWAGEFEGAGFEVLGTVADEEIAKIYVSVLEIQQAERKSALAKVDADYRRWEIDHPPPRAKTHPDPKKARQNYENARFDYLLWSECREDALIEFRRVYGIPEDGFPIEVRTDWSYGWMRIPTLVGSETVDDFDRRGNEFSF